MTIRVFKCILVSFAFGLIFDFSDMNIVPVIIGLLYGMICTGKNVVISKMNQIYINIVSLLFTVFLVMAQIENVIKYESNLLCIISFAITLAGVYLLINLCLVCLVDFCKSDSIMIDASSNRDKGRYVFIGVLAILLMFWTWSFLIAYPGIVNVDTLENLEQALGLRKMNVFFPFYMTLYLRFCWNLGIVLWNNANAGIAIYCITQMIVMSLVVSYMFYRLYLCRVRWTVLLIALAYYIFIPYHAHCSYTLLKDIPCSIGMLLFIQILWEYYIYGEPDRKIIKVVKCTLLIVSGAVMALARANSFYAFLVAIPFIVFIFYKRQKRIILYLLMTLVVTVIMRGPVFDTIIFNNNQKDGVTEYPVYDVRYENNQYTSNEADISSKTDTSNEADISSKTDTSNEVDTSSKTDTSIKTGVSNKTNINKRDNWQEGASDKYAASGIFIITSQQLGRVAVDRELSEAEYERLNTVINVDAMRETYVDTIATNGMRQINNRNTKEYLSVWIEFGMKYPYTYFVAWKDMTSGYWNPCEYTGEVDLDFCTNNPEVYQASPLPQKFSNWRLRINELLVTDNVPIIKLFWCNGFWVWVTFVAILLTATKRNTALIGLYAPLIGLWGTMLLVSPANGGFRYIYPIYLCLPLSLLIPFIKGMHEEKEDEHLLHQ